MATSQKEPTTTPETDEIPPSTFGHKLHQYAFTNHSPASPKRPITRSSSTLQQLPLSNYFPPQKPPSHTSSPSKRKSPSTPTPKKRNKRPPSSTPLSPPNNLTDTLAPSLLILFVGLNPGLTTATTGHAYAHPSNLFYRLLHASSITPLLHHPRDSPQFPHLYSLGLTNIVTRPTRDMSSLSKEEMDEGVKEVEKKVKLWKPEVVCLVGKGVWESVWRVGHGGRGFRGGEFAYGWQDEWGRMGGGEGWEGSRVFVATTTSGLAAGMGWGEKVGVWRELGEWVGRRRGEREREREAEGGRDGEVDNDRGVGKGGVDRGEEEAVE